MPPSVRRGYEPQDLEWFAGPGLVRLQAAQEEVLWLLDLLGYSLHDLQVQSALIYLDAPVSNSGRLRQRILERSAAWRLSLEVLLVPDPDSLLIRNGPVFSSDSVILDRCTRWLNLADILVVERIPQAWVVDLGRSNQPERQKSLSTSPDSVLK